MACAPGIAEVTADAFGLAGTSMYQPPGT
jgi:hypothetical protein